MATRSAVWLSTTRVRTMMPNQRRGKAREFHSKARNRDVGTW
jgi:hypothetical protein